MDRAYIDKSIRERLQSGVSVRQVGGAFGDTNDCDAFLDFVDDQGEHLFGYRYVLRGTTDARIIDSIACTKRSLVSLVRLFPLSVLFPGRIVRFLADVYRADLKGKNHTHSHRPFAELRRVGLLFCTTDDQRDALECTISFLNDTAYRLRLQDFLGMLKSGRRRDVLYALKSMYLREHHIKPKILLAYRIAWFLLLVPPIAHSVKRFYDELNLKEVVLDENDWFFCLKRTGYDFGGRSIQSRLAEFERLKNN